MGSLPVTWPVTSVTHRALTPYPANFPTQTTAPCVQLIFYQRTLAPFCILLWPSPRTWWELTRGTVVDAGLAAEPSVAQGAGAGVAPGAGATGTTIETGPRVTGCHLLTAGGP